MHMFYRQLALKYSQNTTRSIGLSQLNQGVV